MLGTLAWPLAWALAYIVYRTRPQAHVNRSLAALLLIEGLVVGWNGGLTYLFDNPGTAAGFRHAGLLPTIFIPLVYIEFLGTLESPIARRLRHPLVRGAAAGWVLLALGAFFLVPEAFTVPLSDPSFAPWEAEWRGPLAVATFGTIVATYLLGLVTALSVVIAAPRSTVTASQARTYALAFGIRDASFAPVMAGWAAWALGLPTLVPQGSAVGIWLTNVATIVLVTLLAYGILRYQLFDIDLKLKWTLEKSTLAAMFGVVFVIVAEVAELVLGLDGTLYGLLAAITVGLFFRRVESGAERVADRLMPGVEDTEAYREQRKRELYRASLEELHTDGAITAKERRMLGRLQDELGLEGGEASRIEADVVEAGGGEPA